MLTFEGPVSRSELARGLGVDRVRIWELEQAGKIPAGMRVRGNRTEFGIEAQLAAARVVEAARV